MFVNNRINVSFFLFSPLVDGPFASPMQSARRCRVALCVAAGVGITPFVAMLRDIFR